MPVGGSEGIVLFVHETVIEICRLWLMSRPQGRLEPNVRKMEVLHSSERQADVNPPGLRGGASEWTIDPQVGVYQPQDGGKDQLTLLE